MVWHRFYQELNVKDWEKRSQLDTKFNLEMKVIFLVRGKSNNQTVPCKFPFFWLGHSSVLLFLGDMFPGILSLNFQRNFYLLLADQEGRALFINCVGAGEATKAKRRRKEREKNISVIKLQRRIWMPDSVGSHTRLTELSSCMSRQQRKFSPYMRKKLVPIAPRFVP